MARLLKIALAAAVAASAWRAQAARAQVHVERDSAGRVVVTDQEQGGERVLPYLGPGLKWQRRDGRLEVLEEASQAWAPAPRNYPEVLTSARLVLGYGFNDSAAVFDATRCRWVPWPGTILMGYVSRSLALGVSGPGRLALYDIRRGSWQETSVDHELIALSDALAVFFGQEKPAAVYDGSRGAWLQLGGRYAYCIVGNRLALFFGGEGGASRIYDSATGSFVAVPGPVLAVRIHGEAAAVLEEGSKARVYVRGGQGWASFTGEADQVDFQGDTAVVVDRQGYLWTFDPGSRTFTRKAMVDLALPSVRGYGRTSYPGYYYAPSYYVPPSRSPGTSSSARGCKCASYSDDTP